ncbi:MAG: ferrochelatase [Proteobacteria bacterium]|nr:ferrochelatase [Pseudomonadota bacterium]
MKRPGILLINFGGPQSEAELQPFLEELFLDVLPLPSILKGTVARWISTRRASNVAPSYKQIGWSPLVPSTFEQADALREALGPDAPPLAVGMMLSPPTLATGLRDLLDQGVDGIVALALFPQWSFATSAAAFDRLDEALEELGQGDLPLHRVPPYFAHPAYIRALAETVRQGIETMPGEGPIHLLFSPHGLPLSFIRNGDPYPEQCRATIREVIDELGWTGPTHVGWQSRVGPVKWIEPSTEASIQRLGAEGVERVLVVPVAFVGDHIETLHELDIELAEEAHKAGIPHFARSPALNTNANFIACLASLATAGVARFGTTSCVRCTLPITPGYVAGRCATCRFTPPKHLQG